MKSLMTAVTPNQMRELTPRRPARQSKREIELRVMLRQLTHIAGCLNARQHAGLPITPIMWSALHQMTNEARALLHPEAGPASHSERTER